MISVSKLKLLLLLICILRSSFTLVPLPRKNILHPTSGLTLQYLSEYSPADTIVPLTVSIPFTLDLCYLLPLHALQKIPTCHQPYNATSTNSKRKKRFIAGLIAVGIGSAALTMSTANMMHMVQIEHDVNAITKSLTTLESQTTELFHLQTDVKLSACRTEAYADPIFIHQMGQQWVISTETIQQCHLSVFSETDPPYVIQTTARTLPAIALLTIPPKTTLICSDLSIPVSVQITDPLITIWDFSLTNYTYGETFDIDHYLRNSSRWPKIPYLTNNIRALYQFIKGTPTTPHSPSLRDIHRQPLAIFNIAAFTLIIILLTIIGYCFCKKLSRIPTVYFPVPTTTLPNPTA
ncbi:unnamed protein product [Adineta steineri]|uniref:Uncharacterized protein n=1 Tax=Adineta steineri TaxID=433720 RepID=A0A819Y1T1_9BILA|nr:unnamed protein product [Adineta steineri]CAF4149946.1 unnamed protein product [Adineta steineri]